MDSERKRLDVSLRAAVVWEAIDNSVGPVTIQQIADACGMKRTPYLASILENLWKGGYIETSVTVQPNGYAATVHWTAKRPDWM